MELFYINDKKSTIRPSIIFSSIVKLRSNPFLIPTSTKRWS